MLGLFKRDGKKPWLGAVRFDTTGYLAWGEPKRGKIRVWYTPDGDRLGLYLFTEPPDLPAGARSANELAEYYCRLLGNSGGRLVEVRVVVAGGCPAIRTILSVPRQPSGRVYFGYLTLPFRDFCFVINCRCAEGGPAGFEEAQRFDRSRAANEPIQSEGGRFDLPGWSPDDPKYDAEFTDRPVARVRRVLDHVASTLVLADDVLGLPRFPLPQNPA